ncbi:MAG TPA: homoserine dehydrogenase [Thermoplasmata archaeon]|nr:homoserine dehydrogenase [Thermoplasmata archaeon]
MRASRSRRRCAGTSGRSSTSEGRGTTQRRIVLAGFGNVGREFARLLLEQRAPLANAHRLDASVVGILTRRHGSVENARGIDLRKALRVAEAGGSIEGCGRPIRETSVEAVRKLRADMLVEVTPLRIAPRQVALDHMLAAFASGKHVITANKGPVVYHYRRLRAIARAKGLGFRFEGTVMDGAPVFNLFLETLRGARIESFEGILNSTSNFILSEIEAGKTYADGIESARTKGLLETDPAMDLDGWDATVKACLVANVLMGGSLRPEDVPRQGISSIEAARIQEAAASGKRLKQIARGWRDGRTVKASVGIEVVGPDHPLFPVAGTSSSLLVRTDMLKELQIVERNPGIRQTSYALYSDLLAIHEGRLSP